MCSRMERLKHFQTAQTFYAVRRFQGLPGGFCLNAEPVAMELMSQKSINIRSETASCRFGLR